VEAEKQQLQASYRQKRGRIIEKRRTAGRPDRRSSGESGSQQQSKKKKNPLKPFDL